MALPPHVCRPYSEDTVVRAADAWRAGQCVVFPTETVYGLGARADDDAAVSRIYEAKGRPSHNPLIVHVADVEAVAALVLDLPRDARPLIDAFWPGPLTLVLAVRPGAVTRRAIASGDTIAVRVPAHPVARELLVQSGLPIAAPSANRSTSVSPTQASHAMQSLDGGVELVVDGGPTGYGIESTIIDATQRPFVLLRHGAIPFTSLAARAHLIDRGAEVTRAGALASSPGRDARHYAPRSALEVVHPAAIERARSRWIAYGERVGAIVVSGGSSVGQPAGDLLVEILPDDPGAYAARLYASLHRLDDAGCDRILVADVPREPAWAAIRDRLTRASAPR